MLADFERVLNDVQFHRPRLRFAANVTGAFVTDELTQPDYWLRQIRSAVRFSDAIQTLYEAGYRTFLEVGPGSTLSSMGQRIVDEGVWLASLREKRNDWEVLLGSAGKLFTLGIDLDWQDFDRDYQRQRVALPTYPFQRQRYWPDAGRARHSAAPAAASRGEGLHSHPLLGERRYSSALRDREALFESWLGADSPPRLGDHRVFGRAVLPAAAFLEMALAAGSALFGGSELVLEEVIIQQALILPPERQLAVEVLLEPRPEAVVEAPRSYSFRISSRDPGGDQPSWTLHATGELSAAATEPPPHRDPEAFRAAFAEEIPAAALYDFFAERGLEYGAGFRAVAELRRHGGETLGSVRLPEAAGRGTGGYQLHPALLDGCLQTLGPAFEGSGPETTWLPVGCERLRLFRPAGEQLLCHTRCEPGDQLMTAGFSLFDPSGEPVAEIEGLSVRRADRGALLRGAEDDPGFYELVWRDQPRPEVAASETPRRWLIVADPEGLGEELARALAAGGDRCVVAVCGEGFRRLGEGRYEVDPGDPRDFERLLAETGGAPFDGCVHLPGLTPPPAATEELRHSLLRGCGSALHLARALAAGGGDRGHRLWLVTRGAQPVTAASAPLEVQQAPLWGLGRVIPLEGLGIACRQLDLDPDGAREDHLSALLRELAATDDEDQVAYRGGNRYLARLSRRAAADELALEVPEGPCRLRISSYGTFENLRLEPLERRPPGPREVEIEVGASGLNFRDVLRALGITEQLAAELGIASAAEMPFGFECSGTVSAVGEEVSELRVGEEVMAMAWGGLDSFVTVPVELAIARPEGLGREQAAAVPLVYLTALYGLEKLARIQAGDRVLIHAAAGGVGQAALGIAHRAGAEVFATASPGKWPGLRAQGVEHLMSSRNLEFGDRILELTGGEGVDVVLNSLNGELIPQSLRVLKDGGRFVELGKLGILTAEEVRELKPGVSYHPFDLGDVARSDPGLIAGMLRELAEALGSGGLEPPAIETFPLRDVVAAFRHMAQARHFGKIVITREPAGADRRRAAERGVPAGAGPGAPVVRPDASYLVTGGLGGLGIEVARWMVAEGAGPACRRSRAARPLWSPPRWS